MTIENVILTADNCRYCLMCRHVAPVERVTHRETLSPHGLGLIIASVRRGLLKWNEDTVAAIYSASDNGNSRAACVTDQPLPEAIAAVRAEIVSRRLAPPVVYELDAAFKQWGTPYARQLPDEPSGQGETALFVGDAARYLWPQAVPAALRLLAALGIEPAQIGIGRNNGYLASSLGLVETAQALAQANLAELRESGARRMLVLSPGDAFTFEQLYDERLGVTWPAEVELLELTQLLAARLEAGELRFRRSAEASPYAYVDPTLAVRRPWRHEAPRRLLAAVMETAPRELFWRRERAHPVGNTALQFTQPEIAEKLTRARLEDARRSGAQLLVTDDPGTLRELSEPAGRFGLRVQGLYELLAEHLAG
jgi:Fe-S oxidoreductase